MSIVWRTVVSGPSYYSVASRLVYGFLWGFLGTVTASRSYFNKLPYLSSALSCLQGCGSPAMNMCHTTNWLHVLAELSNGTFSSQEHTTNSGACHKKQQTDIFEICACCCVSDHFLWLLSGHVFYIHCLVYGIAWCRVLL